MLNLRTSALRCAAQRTAHAGRVCRVPLQVAAAVAAPEAPTQSASSGGAGTKVMIVGMCLVVVVCCVGMWVGGCIHGGAGALLLQRLFTPF